MSDPAIKAFLEAAQAWETDELVRARKREGRAWIFAILGVVTALAACVAVALLTPLKSVEPFIVRVDKSNGSADIITRVNEQTISFDEAIDKYFLSRYVNYREEYSTAMAYANYESVSLMSTSDVGTAYFAQVNPKNPRSPTAVYRTDGSVEASITAISILGKGVAQVRFERIERTPNQEPRETAWIATISYQYLKASQDAKARMVNPVGFQVTDYRLDPETLKPKK
ncbi:MAG TPA: VirB8/TrbF family protein [Luteibacter sp.]|nr:VirB8/TrbF family protein [Luteibacter sp.]